MNNATKDSIGTAIHIHESTTRIGSHACLARNERVKERMNHGTYRKNKEKGIHSNNQSIDCALHKTCGLSGIATAAGPLAKGSDIEIRH
jgi:hypothetical protein